MGWFHIIYLYLHTHYSMNQLISTPPKFNIAPKKYGWKTTFLLGFRGELFNFRWVVSSFQNIHSSGSDSSLQNTPFPCGLPVTAWPQHFAVKLKPTKEGHDIHNLKACQQPRNSRDHRKRGT